MISRDCVVKEAGPWANGKVYQLEPNHRYDASTEKAHQPLTSALANALPAPLLMPPRPFTTH